MIELDSKEYGKVMPLLEGIEINTLFAEAVLARKVAGKVYTDSELVPQTYYVVHPYGMSLLFGAAGNEAFNRRLYDYLSNLSGAREQAEWLQTDPAGDWSAVIDSMLSGINRSAAEAAAVTGVPVPRTIERNTRVNFRFNRELYQEAKRHYRQPDGEVVPAGQQEFRMQAGSVIPRYFWRDADHFASEGAGFSLLAGGETASTAFSSCRTERQLEIGIETGEAYRGKGYALAVCSALIDYCLAHELEPVWACRLENRGSYKLAQRLGFVPTLTLPYYHLRV
ncbi:GNAT family N-acetyltransferase [Paenibacillus tengchongensis]|uniref:GNAT family N-acetyltransferase n=1 Tax=Paenibacillus tengchongensis TaxID=2608684 RepID=UPI00124D90A3|nr:GNAT family N-acetyltransferase [Paenibacillus tengchongensis]